MRLRDRLAVILVKARGKARREREAAGGTRRAGQISAPNFKTGGKDVPGSAASAIGPAWLGLIEAGSL